MRHRPLSRRIAEFCTQLGTVPGTLHARPAIAHKPITLTHARDTCDENRRATVVTHGRSIDPRPRDSPLHIPRVQQILHSGVMEMVSSGRKRVLNVGPFGIKMAYERFADRGAQMIN